MPLALEPIDELTFSQMKGRYADRCGIPPQLTCVRRSLLHPIWRKVRAQAGAGTRFFVEDFGNSFLYQ